MLRSVLFLTCFTAILHHEKLLDSVDVLALKFLPENAFEQKPRQDNASFRTLVLGITPDLFENEFGGHTPINRDGFRKLIRASCKTPGASDCEGHRSRLGVIFSLRTSI